MLYEVKKKISEIVKKFDWLLLALCVMIPVVTGCVSSVIIGKGVLDYKGLAKPPLAPSGWMFSIIWLLLYLLIGVALYLIMINQDVGFRERKMGLWLFGGQLFFNFLWNILFFKFGLRFNGFLVIIIIICSVVMMSLVFKRIDKKAFYLLIPYMVWLVFLLYFNIGMWILNM